MLRLLFLYGLLSSCGLAKHTRPIVEVKCDQEIYDISRKEFFKDDIDVTTIQGIIKKNYLNDFIKNVEFLMLKRDLDSNLFEYFFLIKKDNPNLYRVYNGKKGKIIDDNFSFEVQNEQYIVSDFMLEGGTNQFILNIKILEGKDKLFLTSGGILSLGRSFKYSCEKSIKESSYNKIFNELIRLDNLVMSK